MICSKAAASLSSPLPRRMARSMLSLGMFSARALSTARRKRKFESASPPPSRAATAISRASRVKIAPRLASAAPFLRLMVDHFECPDIRELLQRTRLSAGGEFFMGEQLYHDGYFGSSG